jgi:hypothetical protein
MSKVREPKQNSSEIIQFNSPYIIDEKSSKMNINVYVYVQILRESKTLLNRTVKNENELR